MNNQVQRPTPDLPASAPESELTLPQRPVERPRDSQRRTRTATILGSLLIGGVAGAAILGPLSANAASPSPVASTNPAVSTTPPSGSRPDTTSHVSDASVVAKAIGITEAELTTALQGGQTVAQVATAKGVAVQTVIDALIADDTSELSAQVTAGRISQAQADAKKAEITQRATNQVNGTLMGGRH